MSQDSILLLLLWWSLGAPLLFFKSVSYFICLNIYDKAASQTQRSYFSNQNKCTNKICLTALWTARNMAFRILSPLFCLVPQNLVIYLGSQACSLPYGLSVFF